MGALLVPISPSHILSYSGATGIMAIYTVFHVEFDGDDENHLREAPEKKIDRKQFRDLFEKSLYHSLGPY